MRYELRAVGVFDRDAGVPVTPADSAAWAEYHAWLSIPGNVPDAPPPPPGPTLAYAIAEKIAAIEARAYEERAKVTLPASPQEMASWSLKFQEATAYQASGSDADAPMLAIEGAVRGTGTADIASRVLKNAQDYQRAEGAIAGTSGMHKDAVNALKAPEQVLAYDISTGWPSSPPPAPSPAGQPQATPSPAPSSTPPVAT